MSEPGARILIVDDDPAARDIVGRRLEMQGHDILLAEDGWAALELIKTNPPDLMIVDMMMPGLDGIGLIKRLRADASLVSLPVLMLTARDRAVDKQFGLEAGADDYLGKPFEFPELIARVNALLRRSRGWVVPQELVQRGHVITFVGAKGGSGTTTIAANVAVALTRAGKSTLLAEFTAWGGTVANHLGITVRRRLDRIPLNKPGIITPTMIENTLHEHPSGLNVLIGRLREDSDVTDEAAQGLVEAVRRCTDFLVVDTDGSPTVFTRAAARMSSQVWVVVEPEPVAIERAAAFIERMEEHGVTGKRVGVIVNQTSPIMTVDSDEIARVTGIAPTFALSAIPNACAAAIQRGTPIVELAPQFPAAQILNQFAIGIAERPIAIQRSLAQGSIATDAPQPAQAG